MVYTDGFHIAADTFAELFAYADKYRIRYKYFLGTKIKNFVCPPEHKDRLKLNIRVGQVAKLQDSEMYEQVLKMNNRL